MRDISIEVGEHSEEITLHLISKGDRFISFTVKHSKLKNKGGLFLAYETPICQTSHFDKIWSFKTKTTTWKFLAGYEPESLVKDLFDLSYMPHEEKLYIANAIIWACDKLENGDTDNG